MTRLTDLLATGREYLGTIRETLLDMRGALYEMHDKLDTLTRETREANFAVQGLRRDMQERATAAKPEARASLGQVAFEQWAHRNNDACGKTWASIGAHDREKWEAIARVVRRSEE